MFLGAGGGVADFQPMYSSGHWSSVLEDDETKLPGTPFPAGRLVHAHLLAACAVRAVRRRQWRLQLGPKLALPRVPLPLPFRPRCKFTYITSLGHCTDSSNQTLRAFLCSTPSALLAAVHLITSFITHPQWESSVGSWAVCQIPHLLHTSHS